MKEFIVYDKTSGEVTQTEPFGADAENVNVTVDGATSNAEDAVEGILDTIYGIADNVGVTSGVIVDDVGELDTDMGNIKAGVNIDGMPLDKLLLAAYGEKNTFSILHLSDTHNGTACIEGCANIANEDDDIGFILHTGDMASSSYNKLLNVDCRVPRLGILGNHDAWDDYKDETAAAAALQALCGNDVIYGEGIDDGVAFSDSTYWYKDVVTDAGKTIRFIAVNEYDYSTADFGVQSKTPWIYAPVRTQRQMKWLCDLLKNTPSDYFIVLVTHTPLQENTWPSAQEKEWVVAGQYGTSLDGSTWYAKVIHAYLTHGVFNGTATVTYREYFTLNFTYDFSDLVDNATFICHLCGHLHQDRVGHLSAPYDNQLMLCVTRADTTASGAIDDVDRTEITWAANKVTFDLSLKQVVVERVGSTHLKNNGGERTRIVLKF